MRLIDADALDKKAFYRTGIGSIITIGDLHAAPTVSCEECKRRRPEPPQSRCYIVAQASEDWQRTDEQMDDFGCGYFERRQG